MKKRRNRRFFFLSIYLHKRADSPIIVLTLIWAGRAMCINAIKRMSFTACAMLIAGCATTPKPPSLCTALQQFIDSVEDGETKRVILLRAGSYPDDFYRLCDSALAGESGRQFCSFILAHAPVKHSDAALNAIFLCLQDIENNALTRDIGLKRWQGDMVFARKDVEIRLDYHMDDAATGEEDNTLTLSVISNAKKP